MMDITWVCQIIEESYMDYVVFIFFRVENLVKLHVKYLNLPVQYVTTGFDGLIQMLVME